MKIQTKANLIFGCSILFTGLFAESLHAASKNKGVKSTCTVTFSTGLKRKAYIGSPASCETYCQVVAKNSPKHQVTSCTFEDQATTGATIEVRMSDPFPVNPPTGSGPSVPSTGTTAEVKRSDPFPVEPLAHPMLECAGVANFGNQSTASKTGAGFVEKVISYDLCVASCKEFEKKNTPSLGGSCSFDKKTIYAWGDAKQTSEPSYTRHDNESACAVFENASEVLEPLKEKIKQAEKIKADLNKQLKDDLKIFSKDKAKADEILKNYKVEIKNIEAVIVSLNDDLKKQTQFYGNENKAKHFLKVSKDELKKLEKIETSLLEQSQLYNKEVVDKYYPEKLGNAYCSGNMIGQPKYDRFHAMMESARKNGGNICKEDFKAVSASNCAQSAEPNFAAEANLSAVTLKKLVKGVQNTNGKFASIGGELKKMGDAACTSTRTRKEVEGIHKGCSPQLVAMQSTSLDQEAKNAFPTLDYVQQFKESACEESAEHRDSRLEDKNYRYDFDKKAFGPKATGSYQSCMSNACKAAYAEDVSSKNADCDSIIKTAKATPAAMKVVEPKASKTQTKTGTVKVQ